IPDYEAEELVKKAEKQGLELEVVPVLKDALVFYVNHENETKALTTEQLQQIYSGQATSWSQLGGKEETISDFQREEGTAMQNLMKRKVMGSVSMEEPFREQTVVTDGTVMDLTALYSNSTGAIGYGSYYYWKNMWGSEATSLVMVDGIAPTEETIADGSYPYAYTLCAVYSADEKLFGSAVRKVVAGMLSKEGQAAACALGYVNLEGETIPAGSGLTTYQGAQGTSSSSEESGTNRVIKGSEGNNVTEGMTTNYLIENPIAWENLPVTDIEASDPNCVYSHTIGTISGLADEEVQTKINQRIEEAYRQLTASELPGYRGVGQAIPEGSKRIEDTLKVSVLFNFNNVLSLAITGDYIYALPDAEGNVTENAWGYYNETMALSTVVYLNFDLNTGKELSLKNVFTNGSDYQKILNEQVVSRVSASLWEDELTDYPVASGLKLAGPFQSINAEQKFYLHHDAVYLVFDQDSPQFLLSGFSPVSIPVYFSDVAESLAITARYYDDEVSIYTAEGPKVKALIPYREELDVNESSTWKTGNVEITKSWSYSSSLPSFIKNMVEAEAATTKSVASSLNKAGRQALYQMNSVGRRQGDYCNITVTDYRWLENGGTELYNKYYCYHIENLKEVSIGDIFWAGYDYEAVIEEHLREEIDLQKGLYKESKNGLVPMTQSEQEAKIKSLMKGLSDFCIKTDSVNISFYPVYTSEGAVSIVLQIPFAEFGCDNMTLFQE
ncbi:MAG: substrate-binding domain-containing protein, partial [Firmicutes bacterium]|nr:substrate-binding domain-containing protein [Bacillota bacterium]